MQFTPPEFDMGLLSKVLKVFDNPVTRFALGSAGLGSTVGAALSAAAGNQAAVNAQLGGGSGATYQAGTANAAVIPGAPMIFGNTLFPSLPGVSNATGTIGKILKPGGAVTMLYDAAGNLVGTQRKRRRMNPTNIKAARRAIRRIRGARRVLQRIERSLPTRTVHSRRK
jgi:uncharacterized protein RhaS with RHS repeats